MSNNLPQLTSQKLQPISSHFFQESFTGNLVTILRAGWAGRSQKYWREKAQIPGLQGSAIPTGLSEELQDSQAPASKMTENFSYAGSNPPTSPQKAL